MRRTFENWMAAVDAALLKTVGVTSLDLPDCDYYDSYEDGVTPSTMARRAIREAW